MFKTGPVSIGARVKDISERMDGSISNITLFLNSLMLAGFISKDNTHSRYYLSRKISDIAEKSDRAQYSLLKDISAEEMRKLRNDLNENVLLAVLSGHEIHFIERLQSNRSIQKHKFVPPAPLRNIKLKRDLPHIGIKQSGIGQDCSHFALKNPSDLLL